jgi:hypothetical protein
LRIILFRDEIPGPAMNERKVNGMVENWNDLGKLVSPLPQEILRLNPLLTVIVLKYEETAFISEPEYLTLRDYVKKYGGGA